MISGECHEQHEQSSPYPLQRGTECVGELKVLSIFKLFLRKQALIGFAENIPNSRLKTQDSHVDSGLTSAGCSYLCLNPIHNNIRGEQRTYPYVPADGFSDGAA